MEPSPEGGTGKGQPPVTDPGATRAPGEPPCGACADASTGMNDTASTVSTTASSAVTTLSAATEDTDAPNAASNAKAPASGVAEETDPREALRTGSNTPISADRLRQTLHEAHSAVEALHRAMTNCWRTPISLFDDEAARAAAGRGVPEWAVAIVHKVQQLVDEVSTVSDLADVYDAQILAAKREHRALNRCALLRLLERCDELAKRLKTHLPLLESARAIFDDPSIVPARAASSTAGTGRTLPSNGCQAPAGADTEAPIRILEPSRKSLSSLVWGALKQVTEHSAEILLEAAVLVVESVGTPSPKQAARLAGPEQQEVGGEDQRKSMNNDSGEHHIDQRASMNNDPNGRHIDGEAAE